MYILFVILHVLVSIVLCVAVLLQSSKGGGLAGAFGGAGGATQQMLGSRGMTTLLHKVTIWCGVGFMLTSLVLFMMGGSGPAGSGSVLEDAAQDGTLNADLPSATVEQPLEMPADEAAPMTDGTADDGGADGGTPQTDEPQGDGN
jgi:preprotein translocase subunit SecG